jgi:hypothetical protein
MSDYERFYEADVEVEQKKQAYILARLKIENEIRHRERAERHSLTERERELGYENVSQLYN